MCVCCICVHTCHNTVHGDQRTTFQILPLQILVTLPGFFPDFKDEVMFSFLILLFPPKETEIREHWE